MQYARRACVEFIGEWHVDLSDWFEHIESGFASRFVEEVVPAEPPYSFARLESIGAIADSVHGHAPQYFLVELPSKRFVASCSKGNNGLKGFERLDRSNEIDGARLDFVPAGRLCHDRSNEIVRQDMSPDFLSDQLRRFAAQNSHPLRDLDRP